ncbi:MULTISPECIES: hypothetical protein [unclassified Streptomyces]|uniref:hypothetical protein n=1 Tax=unclassified Streptomyces TaxID=2593676 RepID=UPI002366DC55|nr:MULTISPECIES: hypothetical protein [unclassified Streptomyces]MDF3141197.1 hypothetical protein [Streptomyces sp. T21Q-yed]WDF42646.1 hypothetical protein PBV52_40530 [Streptomyces sp. T12]
MPAHAPWAPCDSPLWRRPVSAIRGALVMALVLCAVLHGLSEETDASVPVSAAASARAAGGDPHGPHVPHGAEDCAADVIIRTASASSEDLSLGAMVLVALVVLVAVSVAVGRPLVRPETRRRRSARTGRVALVRTSRWRI